jgi:hypothetical protein
LDDPSALGQLDTLSSTKLTSVSLAQWPSTMQMPGPPHSLSFAQERQVFAGAVAVPVSSQMGIVPVQSALLRQPQVFFIGVEPASAAVVRQTGFVLSLQSLFVTQPTHVPTVGPEVASVGVTQTGVIALRVLQALGSSLWQPLHSPAAMSQMGIVSGHFVSAQEKGVPPVPWEPAPPPTPPPPPFPLVPPVPPSVDGTHVFVVSQVSPVLQSLF